MKNTYCCVLANPYTQKKMSFKNLFLPFFPFQPGQAVSDSLLAATQHAGTLATATGALMATVGTRTCLLRRGRHVVGEDRLAAANAVATAAADRVEATLDDAMPLAGPSPGLAGEIVAIPVAVPGSASSSAPSSSLTSFKSVRESVSSASSVASISTISASMPAKRFIIRPAIDFEEDVFGDNDSSGSSITLGD